MFKPFKKSIANLLVISMVVIIFTFVSGTKSAEAFTFSFTQLMKVRTTPSTFSLIKKIQFSQIFADLMVTNKLVNVRFSPTVFRKNLSDCSEAVKLCQKEFDSCKGTIDQFDQAGFELLEKANIQCQASCEAPKHACFGLFDNNTELAQPEPQAEPESIQCTGPETKNCTTATGLPGIQKARSCDTTTGEWNFGVCVAEVIIPPQTQQCESIKPSCPTGYSGSFICQNGNWVNQCLAPSPPPPPVPAQCSSNQPQCPVGYVGNYVCEAGNWVNYCQVAVPCTYSYTPWGECEPGYMICYRHRINLGGEPWTCNTPYPIVSEICPCPN